MLLLFKVEQDGLGRVFLDYFPILVHMPLMHLHYLRKNALVQLYLVDRLLFQALFEHFQHDDELLRPIIKGLFIH